MGAVAAKFRRLFRPVPGRLAVGLRAALVVSLWHAPIPWVHFHDLEGPQVEKLDHLSQHVVEFHTQDLGRGRKALDWHAHLVLPWCLHQHEACPDNGDDVPPPEENYAIVTAEIAHLQSAMSLGRMTPAANVTWNDSIDGLLPVPKEVVATATTHEAGIFRQFSETFLDAVALRDLYGVRLC